MKSPDRDAADDLIVRLETFQRAAVTQQAHDLFREAASELATLRRRVAEMEPVVVAAVAWDVARLSDAATAHLLAVTVQYLSPPTRKE